MTNTDNSKKLISEYFPDYDDWLDIKVTMNAVWIAQLSDGSNNYEVIDDDGRPNFDKSWTRLKTLVEHSHLTLTHLFLRWRKRRILVAENAPYFFFARCLEADWGSKQNYNFFLTGTGNDTILVRKWALPVLDEVLPHTYRPLSEIKSEFIIGGCRGVRV